MRTRNLCPTAPDLDCGGSRIPLHPRSPRTGVRGASPYLRPGLLGLGLVTLVLAVVACGPRETPVQRVERLRQQYDVQPNGYQPRTGADGAPELILSMLVRNTGQKGLKELTLLVSVLGPGGKEAGQKRFTIDVSKLVPGVTSQISAVVPGLEVKPGDSVTLELENAPPPEVRSQFPEFSER